MENNQPIFLAFYRAQQAFNNCGDISTNVKKVLIYSVLSFSQKRKPFLIKALDSHLRGNDA